MKIFIITINYNGKQDTLNLLKSLDKIKLPNNVEHQVIVVDNASRGDDVAMIKKKFPQAQIIPSNVNTGFAKGNNLGISSALEQGADWVLLINNDTIADADFLKHLFVATRKHAQAGMWVPKIYFAPGREFHKDRYKKSDIGRVIWSAGGRMDWNNVYGINIGLDEVDNGQYDQEVEVEKATGCCVLMSRKLIKSIGNFDERYFMYYEDDDLSIRAKKAGFEIWYIPESKIWHVNAASSGTGSDFHDYMLTRNRMLFGMQYARLHTKLSLIKESIRILWSGRKWQKIGIRDYYLGNFGKGSWRA